VTGGECEQPGSGAHPVEAAVARFLAGRPAIARAIRDCPLIVAFSGGPDSTALLLALRACSAGFDFRPTAFHVDHRLDPDSARRAEAARRIARKLDVPFTRGAARPQPTGWSLEEWARSERYRLLAAAARTAGAGAVLTAHHRLDQAETVLLRILHGSGAGGLSSIRPVSRWLGVPLLRPLLDVEPAALGRYVVERGIDPVDDPTNHAPGPHRNFVRHRLLPALELEVLGLAGQLDRLARAARGAERAVCRGRDEVVEPSAREQSCEVRLDSLIRLPAALRPAALAHLHRLAGAAYPPTRRARSELERQIGQPKLAGRAIGCDCGGGWRWEQRGDRLRVVRSLA